MAKLKWLSVLTGAALFVSMNAYAQDEFEEVKVLDHPKYSLTGRFSVDADIVYLPLDAYYKPILGEIAVSFQPVDWFSWEVGRFGYSLTNYDTGFYTIINNRLAGTGKEFDPNDPTLINKDLRFHASSTGYFNLLYSKSNFFNQAIVYHYWQLGTGVSYYDFKQKSQTALDIVLRARFFFHKHFMVQIRGGHSIGFNEDTPGNITFLGLGVGFAI